MERVCDMTKLERQAEHLRHLTRKIGFYIRRQNRDSQKWNYNYEIRVLTNQANRLMEKIHASQQGRAAVSA